MITSSPMPFRLSAPGGDGSGENGGVVTSTGVVGHSGSRSPTISGSAVVCSNEAELRFGRIGNDTCANAGAARLRFGLFVGLCPEEPTGNSRGFLFRGGDEVKVVADNVISGTSVIFRRLDEGC